MRNGKSYDEKLWANVNPIFGKYSLTLEMLITLMEIKWNAKWWYGSNYYYFMYMCMYICFRMRNGTFSIIWNFLSQSPKLSNWHKVPLHSQEGGYTQSHSIYIKKHKQKGVKCSSHCYYKEQSVRFLRKDYVKWIF